jgi:hypothetical protein
LEAEYVALHWELPSDYPRSSEPKARLKALWAAIHDQRAGCDGGEPPGALAVHAAILAANGYEEGARNDALLLSANPLLPEERAVIAPLLQ